MGRLPARAGGRARRAAAREHAEPVEARGRGPRVRRPRLSHRAAGLARLARGREARLRGRHGVHARRPAAALPDARAALRRRGRATLGRSRRLARRGRSRAHRAAGRARARGPARGRGAVLLRRARGQADGARGADSPVIARADLEYALPPELIAQEPCTPRDAARLLVLERASGALSELRFADLADAARPEDLFVVNDTRVLPAKLRGAKRSGGEAEGPPLPPPPPGGPSGPGEARGPP